ncbi:MAG TPA: CoA transferase, partial [Candidatus Binataceae bacterium]|nr:CoA transferase [Candidatus Binataceae bacterium]
GGRRKTIFRCKDGYISGLLAGGAYLPSTNATIEWMKEEGAAPAWLTEQGGLKSLTPSGFMSASDADLQELAMAEEALERFLMTKTKKEIWQNILRRRILAAPVATVADIAGDPQLAAREYFVEIDAPHLERKFTMPGAFAKLSATPVGPAGPSPQIGQHDQEVYCALLGLTPERLVRLRAINAI